MGTETIHRSEHAQQYTVVPNAIAQDTSLSLAARGLLVELLSRPPAWRIVADDLARNEPDGRKRVRTALGELRDAGYAVLRQGRLSNGTSWSRWEIYDVPQREASAPPAATRPASGATCADGVFPQVAPDAAKPAAGEPAAGGAAAIESTEGKYRPLSRTLADRLRAAAADADEREINFAVEDLETKDSPAGYLSTLVAKGDVRTFIDEASARRSRPRPAGQPGRDTAPTPTPDTYTAPERRGSDPTPAFAEAAAGIRAAAKTRSPAKGSSRS